jgi:ADP-ribosyl-[dinitrogen reductase] hydrolase
VIAAAEAAGRTLAAEFARPDGPRGGADHADVDDEIEAALRKQLLELLPARWRGEETGVLAGAGGPYCWLVDPHDGTSAFLAGERGSSVSIALLRGGVPVLGVVHAPLSPDRGPDTIEPKGSTTFCATEHRSRECWLMPHCLRAPSCS